MKIPYASSAVVSDRKITGYLLNPAHPVGGSKALFFIRHGFSPEHGGDLKSALLRHLAENEVAGQEQTRYGTRFVVDGPLHAPDGTVLNIRCAWYIDSQAETPRFITAHPLPKS
jgi:hypothetical protein